MRIVIFLSAILLAACQLQNARRHVSLPDDSSALSFEKGVVLLEVIHAAAPRGGLVDYWSSVQVVPLTNPGAQPMAYSLEPVATLGPDTAIFAGVLPAGAYRIALFEGKLETPLGPRDYRATAPDQPGEFFVLGNKVNSLGVMIQASVGNWSWVVQREPSFDLRALTLRLRPDLVALASRDAVPQELRDVKQAPAPITGAHPSTRLIEHDGHAVLGAQLGQVYLRPLQESGKWQSVSLGSHQTVVDLLPMHDERVLVLTATGEIRTLVPSTHQVDRLTPPATGRVVDLGFSRGELYAAVEMLLSDEDDGLYHSIGVYRYVGHRWEKIGGDHALAHDLRSVLVIEGAVLATSDRNESRNRYSSEILRIPLDGSEVQRDDVSFRFLREISPEVVVGTTGPRQHPDEYWVSDNGGSDWYEMGGVIPAGWPAVDEAGTMIAVGRYYQYDPTKIGNYWMRRVSHRTGRGWSDKWTDAATFPVNCASPVEMLGSSAGQFILCDERIFRLVGPRRGWEKEALHAQQSETRR